MSLSVSDIILPQNVPRKSGDVRSPAGAVIQAASEKTGIAGKEIVAVIPAYNEELVIGSVVLKARQYVNKVIVVDDGSRDQTRNVAEMAGAEVIALEKNGGKANALFVGLRRAREEGCRAAVIIDGDGQHKAQDIPQVMSPVLNGNADMVIGSRFLSHNNDVPAYRRLGQKTLDVFTNFGCGYRVTDSQSGFRAFSRKALENMDFNSKGYGIESDMIAHFAKRGLSICEVPISVRYDVPHKHKKNPLSHGFSVLGSIINLISYRRPLLAFGVPGAVLFVLGLVASSLAFTDYYSTTKFPYMLSMVSVSLLILGMLFVIAGLILNALVGIVEKGTIQAVNP